MNTATNYTAPAPKGYAYRALHDKMQRSDKIYLYGVWQNLPFPFDGEIVQSYMDVVRKLPVEITAYTIVGFELDNVEMRNNMPGEPDVTVKGTLHLQRKV